MDIKPKQTENNEVEDPAVIGYFEGAKGVPQIPSLERIARETKAKKAKASEESSAKMAAMDSENKSLKGRLPEYARIHQEARKRYGDHPPVVIWGSIYLVLSLGLMIADTNFLRRSMDMFGIADPHWQMVAAAAFAILAAVPLALALDPERSREKRIAAAIVSGLTIFVLIPLAILRPLETIYGSTINGNLVGPFISQHKLLTRIFFIGLTLAIPAVAAIALDHAIECFRARSRWMRAYGQYHNAKNRVEQIDRDLKQEKEALPHRLEQIEHDGASTAEIYKSAHELGQRRTGEMPQWMSVLKASGIAIAVIALSIVLGAPAFASILLGVAIGGLCFWWFEHVRIAPTPEQFFKTRGFCHRQAGPGPGSQVKVELKQVAKQSSADASVFKIGANSDRKEAL